MAFEVRLPDGTWHSTEDLTFEELEAIERTTGEPWVAQNPYRSLGSYRAIVGAFAIRQGMSDDDIKTWLNGLKAKDLAAGVRINDTPEEDRPEVYENGLPKAEAEPSTGGSAGAPNGTAGPRGSSVPAPSVT